MQPLFHFNADCLLASFFLCAGGRGLVGWGRPFYKGGNENYLMKVEVMERRTMLSK